MQILTSFLIRYTKYHLQLLSLALFISELDGSWKIMSEFIKLSQDALSATFENRIKFHGKDTKFTLFRISFFHLTRYPCQILGGEKNSYPPLYSVKIDKFLAFLSYRELKYWIFDFANVNYFSLQLFENSIFQYTNSSNRIFIRNNLDSNILFWWFSYEWDKSRKENTRHTGIDFYHFSLRFIDENK